VNYFVAPALTANSTYAVFSDFSSSGLIDWRTGQTRVMGGRYVASSADDSLLLFSAYVQKSLYLYSPTQGASNVIAGAVEWPSMSLDGSTVVYNDEATGTAMVYDVASGRAEPLGNRADGFLIEFGDVPMLSPDGRFVAFSMSRNNGEADADYLDVYLYDRTLTNLTVVSQTPEGAPPNKPSRLPTVSWDGQTVVFESLASDLVDDDRNLDFDIFSASIDPTDSDQDGLEDGWELQTFGSLKASASVDEDGDGFSNYEEWRVGTDPKDANSVFRVEFEQGELTWAGSIGRKYEVLLRESLGIGQWRSVRGVTALSDRVVFEVGGEDLRSGFYRVAVID
jgi:hypothetical protein